MNGDNHFKLGIYASDDPYGHGFADSLKKNVLSARAGLPSSRCSTT